MKNNTLALTVLMVAGIVVGPVWAADGDDSRAAASSDATSENQAVAAPDEAPSDTEAASQQSEISPAEASSEDAPATSSASSESVSAAATSSPSGLVSVDFKDADIRQVLRILSLKSGVDIVAGSDVEGLVTIKLTNVPWEQALDIILRTYGFTYERKGNIVRVLTVTSLEKEALSSEVFALNYAKAKDVPDVLKEMLSDRGRVKFDERTNTVIVTDIPSSLFQITQVIQRLDQRTPQVLIETKIVETKLTKSEALGIDWSDSITFTASTVSIPSTFPFPGGADLGEIGKYFIPRAGTFTPSDSASITQGRIPERGGTFSFGTLSSTGLNSVINFLQQRTDTKVVSNPNIIALNNQQASVHIGSDYPIPNYSIDPTTGKTTISGYQSRAIGTVLTVTPHVNPSDEIVVDLKPEITTVAPLGVTYNTGQGSSVTLPEFVVQSAQTQVRIQSGQTIAIGGLVKETTTKTETKVPVLGDIPVLGLLFKSTSRYGTSDPARDDLIIFLTVKISEEAPIPQAVASAPTPMTPPPPEHPAANEGAK